MQAVYDNRETAPVSVQAKAGLELIETMTLRPEQLGPADIEKARAAGLSDDALHSAIAVCTMFNLLDRLADSFGFHVPDQAAFDKGAQFLLKFGYGQPGPVRWLARD